MAVTLQQVFGYPPDNLEERTNIMIRKSFPVVRFFPSIPMFQRGLNLFNIKSAWLEYATLLLDNGFSTPSDGDKGIQAAFLADNFPTDSFTNEYGENFLQKFTDVASEGAASIAQMMGASSATGAYKQFVANLKASESAGGKALGAAGGYVGDLLSSLHGAITSVPSIGKATATGVNLIDRLMAGSRIDFPMVWKSSGFQPSYSMTIRLYNPFPQSESATEKYIIGPIVALMLLGVPRSQDSSTFTWPFLHRIECPGIFELNPGFISNITVVKGGDQQQISFNQRLGVVDVRIDVGSLYSTMMAGRVTSTRPTVKEYAQTMRGFKKITSRRADNDLNKTGLGDPIARRNVGQTNRGEGVISSGIQISERGIGLQSTGNNLNIDQRYTASVRAQTTAFRPVNPKEAQTVEPEDSNTTPIDRVTDAAKEVYIKLKELATINL
jgi:hypothetical protein